MPTRQETFDVVARHLLTQNKRSRVIDEGAVSSSCAYRGDDGLKCAVGCIIPDEYYTKDFEGNRVDHEIIRDLLNFLGYDLALLKQLQNVHDLFEPHRWAKHLRDTAHMYGLRDTVLDEFD